jgi:hypothetical protein
MLFYLFLFVCSTSTHTIRGEQNAEAVAIRSSVCSVPVQHNPYLKQNSNRALLACMKIQSVLLPATFVQCAWMWRNFNKTQGIPFVSHLFNVRLGRRTQTAGASVQPQTSVCGICGTPNGIGTDLFPRTSVGPCRYHSANTSFSYHWHITLTILQVALHLRKFSLCLILLDNGPLKAEACTRQIADIYGLFTKKEHLLVLLPEKKILSIGSVVK